VSYEITEILEDVVTIYSLSGPTELEDGIAYISFIQSDAWSEGGEFDLEVYSPAIEKRYETFKLKPNTALFFKSDQWHRVRPVKSGVRKSIVGWVLGKQWK
jgi:predicted 2-oxoglutarate/Fe(II)-dependent dioxygenase YbiX